MRSNEPTVREPSAASQCLIVFVAVDSDSKPVPVPAWTPHTPAELQRARQAQARIRIRAEIEAAMIGTRYTTAGTAPTTTLAFLAAPSDINWSGKVHGGKTMRWIDEAAYACAARWTGSRVLASYIAGIRFYRPLLIGQAIEVTARLLHTGPHSMHLSVHVDGTDPHTHT
ncbi:hotdog domain-containing protein [Antrihabitans sp. YC2-6]|uniref:acyl-CoA thioesterase n=1 Tax=Antrihabitans sp. YC2-6 TaxID=2799498 RepID=UPI0027DB078C|nr:hotdog domain-containing protein [Antrihabitans sp. YC2-6]